YWEEWEEWWEEEGGYEYAAYSHTTNPEERNETFGPDVTIEADYVPESHADVRRPFEEDEGGTKRGAPHEQCGANPEGLSSRDVIAWLGRREDVQGAQCRRLPPGSYH